MKTLFISYYYPPVKAVGTLRCYYLSDMFSNAIGSVSVLSKTIYSYLPYEQIEISPDISVYRVYAPDYHFIRFWISTLVNKFRRYVFKKNINRSIHNSKSNKTLSLLVDTFPFNCLLGEGGIIYIILGIIKSLQIVQSQKTTIIFSSFRPYSDHIIAWFVKLINPNIYWIADFRDIHVDPDHSNVLYPKLQHRINTWFFRKADLLTCVSEGYLKHVKQYNDSTLLLRNAFPISKLSFDIKSIESFQKFTISYTGMLYGGRRNPAIFFKVIQKLLLDNVISSNDIELLYAGKEDTYWKQLGYQFNLSEICKTVGIVSLQESENIQRKSHLNLMITWASENYSTFPAKFYEYLAARRPILLLINGEKDEEFERLFSENPIGQLFYDTLEYEYILYSYLQKAYKNWQSNKVTYTDSLYLLPFCWEETFNSFKSTILDKIKI